MNALMRTDIIAAQSDAVEPEDFQSKLIANMTAALLRTTSPPCLLRAPTGSGKTFVMSRVLANVSAERDVLWFWFVPFVNLVQQTEDQLAANCSGELTPVMLSNGRNQEPSAGAVLLKSFQERGVLPAPSTVSATAPLPPAAAWSQAIVAAWYSGVYDTPAGPGVATHDEALMWHCADFMHPPGQCGGGFGYWSEAPLSAATNPTEAAKS